VVVEGVVFAFALLPLAALAPSDTALRSDSKSRSSASFEGPMLAVAAAVYSGCYRRVSDWL
jgi:hypothetical protein